jgi:glycosyltransferase involved in cell wall biosynthesis
MHIWYIHHYGGGPGLGFYDRPYQLARAWQKQGHSATIFFSRFHHLLEKDAAPNSAFDIDGVSYIPVPARAYGNNGLSRLANMWDFSRNLYGAGKRWGKDISRPDAIIASSPHPFSIYPAHSLARCHAAKLIFEIRDIWPLSITEILGTSRLHPFVQMCAAAERFALGKSDLVAAVLPRADRYLADRGYGTKPFVWVPNGVTQQAEVDTDSFLSQEAVFAVRQMREWRSQGLPIVIYTGSIGKPNALDLIVKAIAHAASAHRNSGCALVVAGKGDQLESLRAFVKERDLSVIHFTGVLPKTDAIGLLKHADIAYAGLRNVEGLFKYGVSPNKIADYLYAGLPVLLPLAACGDPVSQSGAGIARKAETPEAVWDALHELIVMPEETRRALGKKGRTYMAREYDYDIIASRYIQAITNPNALTLRAHAISSASTEYSSSNEAQICD